LTVMTINRAVNLLSSSESVIFIFVMGFFFEEIFFLFAKTTEFILSGDHSYRNR
jgi:hypothetical protein